MSCGRSWGLRCTLVRFVSRLPKNSRRVLAAVRLHPRPRAWPSRIACLPTPWLISLPAAISGETAEAPLFVFLRESRAESLWRWWQGLTQPFHLRSSARTCAHHRAHLRRLVQPDKGDEFCKVTLLVALRFLVGYVAKRNDAGRLMRCTWRARWYW